MSHTHILRGRGSRREEGEFWSVQGQISHFFTYRFKDHRAYPTHNSEQFDHRLAFLVNFYPTVNHWAFNSMMTCQNVEPLFKKYSFYMNFSLCDRKAKGWGCVNFSLLPVFFIWLSHTKCNNCKKIDSHEWFSMTYDLVYPR